MKWPETQGLNRVSRGLRKEIGANHERSKNRWVYINGSGIKKGENTKIVRQKWLPCDISTVVVWDITLMWD